MRFVVTLMVRDEVDVIAAMIEHTLSQEPDLIIATDNASVDGTTEVLQRYADLGLVELHHDSEHRKQQHAVVTAMARRARTEYAADWVINADADEFWIPVDKSLTLRQALERIPLSLNAFTVPVTNLVGRPARRGSGLAHLIWRDLRPAEELQQIGIYAQPTGNAVHRGEPDVVVAQGNHFVSIKSNGQPDPDVALEVLHVPWRSWTQFEQKVSHAGRSYEANPELRPSKNHHGMADRRRQLAGRLLPAFLLRQPSGTDLKAGEVTGWFVRDEWLLHHLQGLAEHGVCPDLLAPLLDDSDDDPFSDAEIEAGAALGKQFFNLESERRAESVRADRAEEKVRELSKKLADARNQLRAATAPRPVPDRARAAAHGVLRRTRKEVGRARRRLRPR
ncbi:glycosyltransferase family 2 protein [uncultured Jatrophihabitans sp.]|uniref:glycosyltransferase family 2 protein n=1 Tax=uncultured Jatrophihabitans sp. TaxID=1610747 RepID=UPI0035CBE159